MKYDFKNKWRNLVNSNRHMLNKTLRMFNWLNLPDTIPHVELERMLQISGYAFITEFKGNLYAFVGGLGGQPDVYGNPTKIIIANPALNFNTELSIKDDGVLILNDDLRIGLMPLINKYNTFLIENDINMMLYGYNTRLQKIISASDDRTKASAEIAIKKSIEGDISIIGENIIFDGLKVQGSNGSVNTLKSLVEFNQYIKASLHNELGMTSNFNMKRERLITDELQSDEANYAFIINMLENRTESLEKLNKRYGLNVSVDFGSVWKLPSQEILDGENSGESETPYKEENDEIAGDIEIEKTVVDQSKLKRKMAVKDIEKDTVTTDTNEKHDSDGKDEKEVKNA